MARQASQSTPTNSLVQQGAKFGLVGISNTIIDYSVYLALTRLFNLPIDRVVIAKYCSGTIAMINSFYWNRRWVFRSRANIGASGLRFLVATLVSIYAIQPGMVFLISGTAGGQAFGAFWYDVARLVGVVQLAPGVLTVDFVIKTVAFGMGVIGSAIWNFTLYKFWAFR